MNTKSDGSWIVCVALACSLHGACVVYFARERGAALSPKLRELEVTMLDPEPAPPPPIPVTPEPPPPAPALF